MFYNYNSIFRTQKYIYIFIVNHFIYYEYLNGLQRIIISVCICSKFFNLFLRDRIGRINELLNFKFTNKLYVMSYLHIK